MSMFSTKNEVVFGAPLRADFLPDQIRARKANKRSERNMVRAIVVTALLCASALVGMSSFENTSAVALSSQNDKLAQALAKQAQYAGLSSMIGNIKVHSAANAIIGYNDVDWGAIVAQLKAGLVSGDSLASVTLNTMAASSADASTVPQTVPGQVGSLNLSVSVQDLKTLAAWMRTLPRVAGYLDDKLVSVNETNSGYTAQLTMALGTEILAKMQNSTEGAVK